MINIKTAKHITEHVLCGYETVVSMHQSYIVTLEMFLIKWVQDLESASLDCEGEIENISHVSSVDCCR